MSCLKVGRTAHRGCVPCKAREGRCAEHPKAPRTGTNHACHVSIERHSRHRRARSSGSSNPHLDLSFPPSRRFALLLNARVQGKKCCRTENFNLVISARSLTDWLQQLQAQGKVSELLEAENCLRQKHSLVLSARKKVSARHSRDHHNTIACKDGEEKVSEFLP